MSIVATLFMPLFMAQDPDQAKIDQWIRLLGDEAIEAREQAQNELLRIGAPAATLLRKASEDPDLERACRARTLLARIEGKKKGSGETVPQTSKAASRDEDELFEEWILNPGAGRVLRLRMRYIRFFGSWFWPFWGIVEGHEI